MDTRVPVSSGAWFDYQTLNFEDLAAHDLVWPLFNITRWGGHSRHYGVKPISVGAHTILCVDLALKHYQATGLLGAGRDYESALYLAMCHDLLESLFHDIRAPLKKLLPDYQALYTKAEEKLFKLLGADRNPLNDVFLTIVDQAALLIERRFVFPDRCNESWDLCAEAYVMAAGYGNAYRYDAFKPEIGPELLQELLSLTAPKDIQRFWKVTDRPLKEVLG